MRLIDADYAKAEVKKAYEMTVETLPKIEGIIAKHSTNYALRVLGETPTIEAEPVRHGRWRNRLDEEITKEFICSECFGLVRMHANAFSCYYKYCPNCGAKMDGEK